MKPAVLVTCLAGALFATSGSQAATSSLTRSFVSSYGSDSNNCSRQAPCRSFATAIANTVAGGEINTLDPGGYGPVTITKSISIVSGLGEAGVLVPAGGTGITITAGPDDQVNLRGLAIEGAGAGDTGIRFNTGGSLTITNSVIRNMANVGMDLEPTATSYFTITDTLVSDNGRIGIYFFPKGASGVARGTLLRVTASHNQWGIYADGTGVSNPTSFSTLGVKLSISDSTIASNVKGDGYGLFANGLWYSDQFFTNTTASMAIGNTLMTGNKYGVVLSGGSALMNGIRIENIAGGFVKCIAGKGYSLGSTGNNYFGLSGDCALSKFGLQ